MAYDITKFPKYKQEVQKLHDEHFAEISDEFKRWAIEQLPTDEFGVCSPLVRKGGKKRWCPICGQDFEGKPNSCPHCGARMDYPTNEVHYTCHGYGYGGKVEERGRSEIKTWRYLEEVTTFEGWQIDRVYVCDYKCKRGERYSVCLLMVAYERWYNPTTNKKVLLGKYVGMYPYMRRIPWATSYFADTEVYVHHNYDYSSNSGGFDMPGEYSGNRTLLYPKVEILPELRYPLSCLLASDTDLDYEKMFNICTTKNGCVLVETLKKCYKPSLLNSFISEPSRFSRHWPSIKLATRWHYDLGGKVDLRDYMDYLEELTYLGKDTRSPKYLLPTDFRKAHSATSMQVARLRERRKNENELKKAMSDTKASENLTKALGKYFGIRFESKHLLFIPLTSPYEYVQEGLAMKHCVGGYYTHLNSLIFSARNKEDNARVETIEVSLRGEVSIIQARGHCNNPSEFHKEVVSCVTSHLKDISNIKESRVVA